MGTEEKKSLMSATIIIPTVSEPTLGQVIRSVKTEIPDGQIIVVGFGESKNVAKEYGVQFLDTKQKTPKPIGINRAVEKAIFDRIIILDADAIPNVGWGMNMLKAFEEGKKVFSGSVDISFGNFWMKTYNLSGSHEFVATNPQQIKKSLPGVNLGFTKEAFQLGGGWDESLPRSQDYEWSLRLSKKGYDLWFIPSAIVTHIPTDQNSFSKVMESWKKSGYYNWIIRKRYKEILHTPRFLFDPNLILLFSPLLGLIPTARILRTSPRYFFKYFYLLPFVYLTKIAWCFGVYEASRKRS